MSTSEISPVLLIVDSAEHLVNARGDKIYLADIMVTAPTYVASSLVKAILPCIIADVTRIEFFKDASRSGMIFIGHPMDTPKLYVQAATLGTSGKGSDLSREILEMIGQQAKLDGPHGLQTLAELNPTEYVMGFNL